MIIIAFIVIGVVLFTFLKGKLLLWISLVCLAWGILAFVPEFFDVAELDDKLNGALVYFSMCGGLFGLPLGIILLIAGTLKRLKEKNPKKT